MIDTSNLNARELAAAVYWMVQGDGNITIPARGINGYFQCVHKTENKDYVDFKASILSQVVPSKVKMNWHNGSQQYFYCIASPCHPYFTALRHQIYNGKVKQINEHGLKLLTPLALAILYQDDGRFAPSKSTISINKPLYSELELLALAKRIVDNWGIIFRLRKSAKLKSGKQGYELGLRYSDKEKFFDLVSPYVVPSMLYKITNGGSSN